MNLFLLPSGKADKNFVSEMSRLLQAYADATSLESIALKPFVVLLVLVLEKPHARSKCRDHVQCVQRRLDLWHLGRFDELLREGRTLQNRLPCGEKVISDDQ